MTETLSVFHSFGFSNAGRKEAALVVVDKSNIRMAVSWLKVLEQVQPEATLAFPDFHGGEISHLERKIQAADKVLDHQLPTATTFRKSLEIRNKRLTGPMREAVSRALSHSLGTAQQYYQAPTLNDAYSAYSVMQDIIGGVRARSPAKYGATEEKNEQEAMGVEGMEEEGMEEETAEQGTVSITETKGKEPATACTIQRKRKHPTANQSTNDIPEVPTPSPTNRKKRPFSKEETNLVAEYFRVHIEKRQFPTTNECRDFLALYQDTLKDRSLKDIYDKCRNIAGR